MRICILLLLLHSEGIAQQLEVDTLYSVEVKDNFIIKIRKPARFSANNAYHLIYVADGSLNLGKYVLGTDPSWKAEFPGNCVVITIGHAGNWHMKRQRDFLPSDAGGYSDKNFGQARNFYLFLKQTLLPHINKKFERPRSTAFIGHSFSGLFCLYTLFQNDKLFERHFAISPSVWANHGELLKIENAFYARQVSLPANVGLQVGGLEIFNRVLSSATEFYETTAKRNYKGFSIGFSTINNANHYSIIKPGVDRILMVFKRLPG